MIRIDAAELERAGLLGEAPQTQPSPILQDTPDPVSYAKHLLQARQQRDARLPGVELGEPSWDLLLDLFVRDAEGRPVTVSDACLGSRSPPTTGLRHLSKLVESGHVVRESDPVDARRTFVRLSTSMHARMLDLLSVEAAKLAGPGTVANMPTQADADHN